MTARQLITNHREATRQLRNGLSDSELCVPCKNAVFDDDFARIGTPAWLNDGLPDCEDLDKPALYCCVCRHVLRAREAARRKGEVGAGQGQNEAGEALQELDWVMLGMEQGIFVHDDGKDFDGVDEGDLAGFEVEKSADVRSIRHRWVDVQRVRGWLEECEEAHGDVCNSHRKLGKEDAGALLLVDVIDGCLVQRKFEERYFALSYVWGQSKQFLTLKDNYQELLGTGNLTRRPITQTIKDAMRFVQTLGERYLWVDTVCIIQDDAKNKSVAIAQMSSIYMRAVATIIAINGTSADAGLSGVLPTSRNDSAKYVAPGLRLTERTPLERVMNEYTYGTNEYVYNTRAWTYQERLLSSRSIIFMKEQIYFQCKTHLVCEDRNSVDYSTSAIFTLAKARAWSQNNKNASKSYNALDEFRWYEEIIPEYTAKQMGFPADIINAFTGVQTELGVMFNWTFVEGLPTQLFDLALLWTPIENVEIRNTTPRHPSWSWTGWIGRVWYKDLVRPLHLPIGQAFKPLAMWNTNTPGALRFDGDSVPFNKFIARKSPMRLENLHYNALTTPDTHFLFDNNNHRCGILHGIQDLGALVGGTGPLEVLCLSQWKRANSMSRYGPVIAQPVDGNAREEYLFNEIFPNVEWCTYNILLVRWWGAGYIRVAVGHIHKDAWIATRPIRKTVSLQ
ncbi:heterokaryon incompatibility protein-domain-containing protein [Phaeosphaeriaceae sp. PMI808]|nr:heterokaryon incompatibility protein-domain-containing protein [Phaeosphaeriaceae sp. PMI808]